MTMNSYKWIAYVAYIVLHDVFHIGLVIGPRPAVLA